VAAAPPREYAPLDPAQHESQQCLPCPCRPAHPSHPPAHTPPPTRQGSVHVHDVSPFAGKTLDFTHTIKHLSFGPQYPGMINPLDGATSVSVVGASSGGSGGGGGGRHHKLAGGGEDKSGDAETGKTGMVRRGPRGPAGCVWSRPLASVSLPPPHPCSSDRLPFAATPLAALPARPLRAWGRSTSTF
jgi:hypothetical protein